MKRVIGLIGVLAAVAATAAEGEANNSLVVQASGGAALFGGVGIVGGLGGGYPGSLGLEYERRLGTFALALGLNASASGFVADGVSLIGGMSIFAEPALRWYPGQAHGLWLGAAVPVGYSGFTSASVGGRTVSLGLAPTVGFRHQFESGLVVQAYGGPSAQAAWTFSTAMPNTRMVNFHLRTGIGVGWAF